MPGGTIGFRWGESGKWNLEEKDAAGKPTKLRLSLADIKDDIADVAFPYFGNIEHEHFASTPRQRPEAPRAGEEAEARRRRDAGCLGA